MLKPRWAQPACRNIEVNTVASTGTWCTRKGALAPKSTVSSPSGHEPRSSQGTKPYSAVIALWPSTANTWPRVVGRCCWGAASSTRNTATLIAISASVTTGRCRVGTVSRSGITGWRWRPWPR